MYLAEGWKYEPNGIAAARKAALAVIMNPQKAEKPRTRPRRRAPPCPPGDNDVNMIEPPKIERLQTERPASVSFSELYSKSKKNAETKGKDVPLGKARNKAKNINRQIRRRKLTVKEQFFQNMKPNPINSRQKSRSYFNSRSRRESQEWLSNFDWKPVKEKKYVGETSQKVPSNRFSSRMRKRNNRRRPRERKTTGQSGAATNRGRGVKFDDRGDKNIENP